MIISACFSADAGPDAAKPQGGFGMSSSIRRALFAAACSASASTAGVLAAAAIAPLVHPAPFAPTERVEIRLVNDLDEDRVASPVVLTPEQLPMLRGDQVLTVTLVDPDGTPRPRPTANARPRTAPRPPGRGQRPGRRLPDGRPGRRRAVGRAVPPGRPEGPRDQDAVHLSRLPAARLEPPLHPRRDRQLHAPPRAVLGVGRPSAGSCGSPPTPTSTASASPG